MDKNKKKKRCKKCGSEFDDVDIFNDDGRGLCALCLARKGESVDPPPH